MRISDWSSDVCSSDLIRCANSFATIACGQVGYTKVAARVQLKVSRTMKRGSQQTYEEIGRATSELQSLMRISYAVFCLKKNTYQKVNVTAMFLIATTSQSHHINQHELSTTCLLQL